MAGGASWLSVPVAARTGLGAPVCQAIAANSEPTNTLRLTILRMRVPPILGVRAARTSIAPTAVQGRQRTRYRAGASGVVIRLGAVPPCDAIGGAITPPIGALTPPGSRCKDVICSQSCPP